MSSRPEPPRHATKAHKSLRLVKNKTYPRLDPRLADPNIQQKRRKNKRTIRLSGPSPFCRRATEFQAV
jgi:hypothetical protein